VPEPLTLTAYSAELVNCADQSTLAPVSMEKVIPKPAGVSVEPSVPDTVKTVPLLETVIVVSWAKVLISRVLLSPEVTDAAPPVTVIGTPTAAASALISIPGTSASPRHIASSRAIIFLGAVVFTYVYMFLSS
jgi:hypothetical protein